MADEQSNTGAILEQLAAEIDALESARTASIFDIGDKLLKAKDAAGRGQWADWLEKRVRHYSERSAQNYMGAARLRIKNARLADLPLTRETIYDLAQYEDDAALRAIVTALDKATTGGKRPTRAEAMVVVEDAHHFFHWQRVSAQYGNLLPRATPIGDLLGYLDNPSNYIRATVTAKLFEMKDRAITAAEVKAAYNEAAGVQRQNPTAPAISAAVTSEAVEPTLAPAMPAPTTTVRHVADRVKARSKPRELSPRERAQELWRSCWDEIESLYSSLEADDLAKATAELAKVLRLVADLLGYTRDKLLQDSRDIEEFNGLAPLYGWERELEGARQVVTEAAES